MNMKVDTSLLLVGGKQILHIMDLKLLHPMGMEMILLGILELVKVNLGIRIHTAIMQEGMTDWDIRSQVIKVLVGVMPMIITNKADIPRPPNHGR